jgi:hypothetical protein
MQNPEGLVTDDDIQQITDAMGRVTGLGLGTYVPEAAAPISTLSSETKAQLKLNQQFRKAGRQENWARTVADAMAPGGADQLYGPRKSRREARNEFMQQHQTPAQSTE